MGQCLHWTSLRYVLPTGVPHMSVSLFSRPYSSVSAPRCALGLSLCRTSETTYCLFEPFKYNHVAFAYFSFLSNPLLHRSCRPPVESILPHASFEHSAEYHLLGNVAEIQNFLRITKINLWSNLATRGRGVHLHTLVDRDAEALQERG